LVGARQEDRYDAIVRAAAVLNTPLVVARAVSDPRYRAGSLRPPRRIGRQLALFDCINCDKCLPACPNDANFVYSIDPVPIEYRNYRVDRCRALPIDGGRFEVRERHQIATFQDFCNDCGNCDTFCPEDGGPYLEKPRFFGSLAAWRQHAGRDGFYVERGERRDAMWGRLRGVEYRLELDRLADRAVFSDGRVTLELRHALRSPIAATAAPGAADGHLLDVSAYLTMAVLLDGVLDPRRANPVNA
jgi:putative selenate reductase